MILRLRSVLDTVVREYSRERVLIVSHQVIVNCMRYLLERMDERQILETDRAGDVPNCSVTSYQFDPAKGRQGKLVPRLVNFVAPLEVTGTPVTAEPDRPCAEPWQSRWAEIMIAADYDMKRVWQGQVDTHINDLKSGVDLEVRKMASGYARSRAIHCDCCCPGSKAT